MSDHKNNTKYQIIFRTSKELFWKYGIKRVSIEEICREAGVSKMTFYKFFPNKIDLAKNILNDLMGKSIVKLKQLIDSEIPFSEKLKEIFLMKLEGTKNISMELIKDIYSNPKLGLMEFMENLQKDSMNVIIEFYKDAQKKGSIRKDVKIDFILSFSTQIIKMMEDDHLVSQYEHPQDLIMESMNTLFYGILTKND